jgi:hypothetical protein
MIKPLHVRFRNSEATDLDEEIREISAPVVMGRGRDTDIMLPDPGVSRRHASLRPTPAGEWYLEDLHSTRGTWLNGRRLQPGESALIVESDLIEIPPWSLLIGGSSGSRGQFLPSSMTEGRIEEAIASPLLRERFDAMVAAVQRATMRGGEEEVFGAMLDSLLMASDLDRAMILRIEGVDGRKVAIRAKDRGEELNPRPYSRTLVNEAIDRKATVRMEENPEFSGAASIIASGAGEAMARQISDENGKPLMLYADRRSVQGNDPEVVAWFDAVASLCEVALRLQRGRIAESERARLAAEMTAARAVQEVLLPGAEGRLGSLSWRTLAIPCIGIAGDMIVARQVGDGLHAMLGDVSGKGARAGLVMAGTQAFSDALAAAGFGPGELVSKLDEWLIRNTLADQFVSLWCGRLEPDGTLRCAVAAHPHCFIRRADGRVERPEFESRLLLGVLECETPENVLHLDPGDSLIVYSDGLYEEIRRDADPSNPREQYGEERVRASIETHGPDPAAILDALVAWCGHDQFRDDLTILVVHRDAEQ